MIWIMEMYPCIIRMMLHLDGLNLMPHLVGHLEIITRLGW